MSIIRHADVNDAGILGNIHALSWQKAYKDILPKAFLEKVTVENRTKYFMKALSENKEEDLIIYDKDEALGFATIGECRDKDFDETYGEIWGIYMHPDYYGRGYGTELMKCCINELKNRGYLKITLWVLEDNKNAISFYEKQGFKKEGKVNELNLGEKINEVRYIMYL